MQFFSIIVAFLFSAVLSAPHSEISSVDNEGQLKFRIDRLFEPLAISRTTLQEAETLIDLNEHYKADWVQTYHSVSITAVNNGVSKTITTSNNVLTKEQKALMSARDIGTKINVLVNYLPKNNLQNNGPKEMGFSFAVEPENTASFIGGDDALIAFIQEHAIDKIPSRAYDQNALAAVKFWINEEGQVENAKIFESSRNMDTDQLLLSAICKLPTWQPASYADGTKEKQEFVLTVGNMESCVINLLNIRD